MPGVLGNANACAFPFPPIGKFRATGFVPYREHAFLSSYPCGCKLRCDFRAQTLPTLVKRGCQLTNLTACHTEQVPKTNACGKLSHNIPLLSDVTVTARAGREGRTRNFHGSNSWRRTRRISLVRRCLMRMTAVLLLIIAVTGAFSIFGPCPDQVWSGNATMHLGHLLPGPDQARQEEANVAAASPLIFPPTTTQVVDVSGIHRRAQHGPGECTCIQVCTPHKNASAPDLEQARVCMIASSGVPSTRMVEVTSGALRACGRAEVCAHPHSPPHLVRPPSDMRVKAAAASLPLVGSATAVLHPTAAGAGIRTDAAAVRPTLMAGRTTAAQPRREMRATLHGRPVEAVDGGEVLVHIGSQQPHDTMRGMHHSASSDSDDSVPSASYGPHFDTLHHSQHHSAQLRQRLSHATIQEASRAMLEAQRAVHAAREAELQAETATFRRECRERASREARWVLEREELVAQLHAARATPLNRAEPNEGGPTLLPLESLSTKPPTPPAGGGGDSEGQDGPTSTRLNVPPTTPTTSSTRANPANSETNRGPNHVPNAAFGATPAQVRIALGNGAMCEGTMEEALRFLAAATGQRYGGLPTAAHTPPQSAIPTGPHPALPRPNVQRVHRSAGADVRPAMHPPRMVRRHVRKPPPPHDRGMNRGMAAMHAEHPRHMPANGSWPGQPRRAPAQRPPTTPFDTAWDAISRNIPGGGGGPPSDHGHDGKGFPSDSPSSWTTVEAYTGARGAQRHPMSTQTPALMPSVNASFNIALPGAPRLASVDDRDIARWRRQLQQYRAHVERFRLRYNVDATVPLSDMVDAGDWCTISEQSLNQADRTQFGTPPNDDAVRRYLNGEPPYEAEARRVAQLFYIDPLRNLRMIQWPPVDDMSCVAAMTMYFNDVRELWITIPQASMPDMKDVVLLILQAILPPVLQRMVRNRITNGLPPEITGPPMAWRKQAKNDLGCLIRLVSENARRIELLRGQHGEFIDEMASSRDGGYQYSMYGLTVDLPVAMMHQMQGLPTRETSPAATQPTAAGQQPHAKGG